ncbi:MAG: hypothetical protein ABIN01_08160 [Ferruginibacter sp.]
MSRRFTKQVLVLHLLLLIFFAFPTIVNAQPGPPDNYDIDTPIDGGLTLLIAAGIGYGAKKIRDQRKKKLSNLS